MRHPYRQNARQELGRERPPGERHGGGVGREDRTMARTKKHQKRVALYLQVRLLQVRSTYQRGISLRFVMCLIFFGYFSENRDNRCGSLYV